MTKIYYGLPQFNILILGGKLKILFAAPFILNTKSDAPVLPMHLTTQAFVDALVFENHDVISVSTDFDFEQNVADCDLVVVMADGNWLIETIENLKPKVKILYYYIISRPRSSLVTSYPMISLPSRLLLNIKNIVK